MTGPAPSADWLTRYGRPCGHWIGSEGRVCEATPTKHFLPGARCQAHTPAALAGRPEPRPDPATSIPALRAKAGLPPLLAPPPMSAMQRIEDRHVTSGKRRASPQAYRDARARQEGRR